MQKDLQSLYLLDAFKLNKKCGYIKNRELQKASK